MIKNLLCRLIGHVVDRTHVWNDNYDYRTNCRRCGQSMIRDVAGWRLFDPARDSDLPRKPHPNDRDAEAA